MKSLPYFPHVLGAVFAAVLSLLVPQAASAANSGDSSANLPAGFQSALVHARGIMIRVPIDKNGRENTNAAEMRVATQAATANQLSQAWTTAQPLASLPGANSLTKNSDSSTSLGWWHWHGFGWCNPYWYAYNYQPWFYANNYYAYGYPYYNDVVYGGYPGYGNGGYPGYGNGGYPGYGDDYGYGCRYYYYPSTWYY